MLLPLFPLPDIVHFPGTRLPLHIFEPRYRTLIADLLELPAEQRRIGMILEASALESGTAELVEPGCAGRLVGYEALEDGRSNVILQGEFRFLVERELEPLPYRRAIVQPLRDELPLIEAERAERLHAQITRLAAALVRADPDGSTIDLADLAGLGASRLALLTNRLAARLDLPALRKQMLLAQPALERAGEVAGILRSRLQLLRSLAPFRHLANRPELN